jgi:hypothetical protein
MMKAKHKIRFTERATLYVEVTLPILIQQSVFHTLTNLSLTVHNIDTDRVINIERYEGKHFETEIFLVRSSLYSPNHIC